MSGPQPPSERCFNENSPRPPVPGEEGEVKGSSRSKDPQARLRSSCDASCAPLGYEPEGRCDRVVVMEQQQRESSSSSPRNSSRTPQLACLQWSRSLHALLEDPRGVKVFENYLHQEGYKTSLSFYFACEGLKDECDPNKLPVIIKAVIRRFFQRPQLAVPDDMRKELTRRYHDGQSDKDMFNLAQKKVYQLLEETAYPNFLRSDIYLKHVRRCQSADKAACLAHEDYEQEDKECYSSPDEPSVSCSANLLPTVHEDSELTTQQQQQQQHHQLQPTHMPHRHQSQPQPHSYHHHHRTPQQQPSQQQLQQQQHHHHAAQSSASTTDHKQGEMRLTKDVLMATEQYRAYDFRHKPEVFTGVYPQLPGTSPYHAAVQRRAQYSSYNPVSRQDSELQSLSSDARTESDNLSLTDASMSDTASMQRRNQRKQHIRHSQQMKKAAMMNRETDIHDTIIPRTQLLSREHTQPKNPDEFARILIEKLERVKRDMDNDEKLVRKLREIEPREGERAMSTGYSDSTCGSMSTVVPKTVVPNRPITDAFLQVEEDSDQAILDQHVSRVWSDLTPSRSPKLASPRPRSPDKCRRQAQIPPQPQGYPAAPATYQSPRKEKDVFSTFSGDSGNVHDFQDYSEIYGAGSMSSLGSHLPKSKSVPSDYADSLHTQDMYLQGQDPRYRRMDAQRSSATKKSMTELTDSGVSVVSDAISGTHRDRLLREWHRKDGSCASGIKAETMNVNKLNRNKKFPNSPQQPFMGDPGMPLLPQPHTKNDSISDRVLPVVSTMGDTKIVNDGKKVTKMTIYHKLFGKLRLDRNEIKDLSATQLEEAKRRLEYEQYEQNRGKQQRYPSGESMPTLQTTVASNQSTLRRGGSKQETSSGIVTVVFSFCDEKVPYRTKISTPSGTKVTLKQFKDVLPKKGSYRYFFKTECEDVDTKVIQEEITDDNEDLPMWDGKIMAQVKALE